MPYTAADVLVTPATIYYAPVGEALPDETTIAYGTAWGGNWEALGYTNAPTTLAYSREEFEVMVEQLTVPLKRMLTTESVTIETQLAEINGTNLQLAIGGSLTTTAAGASQKGFEALAAGGTTSLDVYAWGIEGKRVSDAGVEQPVRLFFYRGTAVLNGNVQFAKAEAAGIPIQIKALADSSQAAGEQLIVIHNVTAPATS